MSAPTGDFSLSADTDIVVAAGLTLTIGEVALTSALAITIAGSLDLNAGVIDVTANASVLVSAALISAIDPITASIDADIVLGISLSAPLDGIILAPQQHGHAGSTTTRGHGNYSGCHMCGSTSQAEPKPRAFDFRLII